MGARLITGAFKATSAQALNIEAHLTHIGLELGKKTDQQQLAYTPGLYIIRSLKLIYASKMNPYPLEVLEKRYTKVFGNNIHKLEIKPA